MMIDHEYTFNTCEVFFFLNMQGVYDTLDTLDKHIKAFKSLTVTDVLMMTVNHSLADANSSKYGWTDISKARVVPVIKEGHPGFTIMLPPVKRLFK